MSPGENTASRGLRVGEVLAVGPRCRMDATHLRALFRDEEELCPCDECEDATNVKRCHTVSVYFLAAPMWIEM